MLLLLAPGTLSANEREHCQQDHILDMLEQDVFAP
jgi:hypothetical protein